MINWSYFIISIIFASSFQILNESNPVLSVFLFILTVISIAILMFMLKVDFLAFVLIIVYAGAIACIFLFVVMMLKIQMVINKNLNLPFGIFIIGFSFVGLIYIFGIEILPLKTTEINSKEKTNLLDIASVQRCGFDSKSINMILGKTKRIIIEIIGEILYTKYINEFILCGIVLLIGILGAIILVN